MSDGKSRPYDVAAWIQFHLLRQAAFHKETTKGDLAVLAEIIQRYHGQHGNAWASHEHLGTMAGVSQPTVKRAKKNLERLGFVTVLAGGRRGSATVYLPNFAAATKKGIRDDTETLGITEDTEMRGMGIGHDTKTPEKGITEDPPSYLPSPADKAEGQVCSNEVSAAPAADGLAAAAPASGFEMIWKAYGRLGNKTKSRAAFLKIDNPDVEHIAERAAAWAASAKPDRKRLPLEKWLDGEKYDEADRRIMPKATSKTEADNDNVPAAPWVGDVSAIVPPGRHSIAIKDAWLHVDAASGDQEVTLIFDVDDGSTIIGDIEHSFFVQHRDEKVQRKDRMHLDGACNAAGITDIEDIEELIGKEVVAEIGTDGSIRYVPCWELEAAA